MIELSDVENNVRLRCEIVGYQFPDSPQDDWCLMKVEVEQGDDAFESIDPALEACELVGIYEWFKCLAENRLPRYAHLTFTEPCIGFEFLAYKDDRVRFSVELGHELKPNFDLNQFRPEKRDWVIVFELNRTDINGLLDGIGDAIKQYPIRDKS